jgi:hypothetical protein
MPLLGADGELSVLDVDFILPPQVEASSPEPQAAEPQVGHAGLASMAVASAHSAAAEHIQLSAAAAFRAPGALRRGHFLVQPPGGCLLVIGYLAQLSRCGWDRPAQGVGHLPQLGCGFLHVGSAAGAQTFFGDGEVEGFGGAPG